MASSISISSILVAVFLINVSLGTLADTLVSNNTICTMSVCNIPDDSLRFFLIGDWGGLPVWPYITPAQMKVAKAMAKMGNSYNTHFQIALGDNIYIVGVKSPDDSRFQQTFEKVYVHGDAMYKPWYVIAGNHDHYGDVGAQIAYTQRSQRWVFPDYYYAIRYSIANGITIDMFTLDTIILCGNTREGKYNNFFEYLSASSSDRNTQGPKDPDAAEKQWHWLEDQLARSNANYIFVVGHYPVYSIAEHGPTPCLVNRLRPLLQKYKVNAYFSGHDHSLQHLNETFDDGWTTHYVLSGAGAYEIKSNKSIAAVPPGSSQFSYPSKGVPGERAWSDMAAKVGLGKGGFVYAEVGQQQATFRYVIGDMDEVHSFTLTPRY